MADPINGKKVTKADLEMARLYVDLAERVLDVAAKSARPGFGTNREVITCQKFVADLINKAMAKTGSPTQSS